MPDREALRGGEILFINQCRECGRIEGEFASPCCPGCGASEDPAYIRVVVSGEARRAAAG